MNEIEKVWVGIESSSPDKRGYRMRLNHAGTDQEIAYLKELFFLIEKKKKDEKDCLHHEETWIAYNKKSSKIKTPWLEITSDNNQSYIIFFKSINFSFAY